MVRRAPTVAVIGAGMSGLYMAVRLKEAGLDFVVFEKGSSVGGVWRENRYPGVACDVPSRYYTFHFELNPDWSQFTSPGPEIHNYFDRVAHKHDLIRHIRFDTEIVSAEFDGAHWRLRSQAGEETVVDFVLTACGVLHHPRIPDIKGMDSFAGALFHSARWDHSVPLEGARIAVVGTGSTGVQIVTALAPVARELVHIQRTPQWIFPLPNWSYSRLTRWALRNVPGLNRLSHGFYSRAFGTAIDRLMTRRGIIRAVVRYGCQLNLRFGVKDPRLRHELTPPYEEPGCKRIVMSHKFYRSIQRDNVRIVTGGISHIEPSGIVTADGTLHEVDVIVLATGFDAQSFIRPMRVTGQDGATLDQLWGDVPTGYQTIGLPKFPNFFMLSGPHNPLGNQPPIDSARDQTAYILRLLELYRDGVYDLAAPTEEATRAFNDALRAAYPNDTVWTSGCSTYYLGKDGYPSVWPWSAGRYSDMLAAPKLEDYELQKCPDYRPVTAESVA